MIQVVVEQEQPSDYAAVESLVLLAFASVPYGDGTEHIYLRELRNSAAFIPELSLVAKTECGEIVGEIVGQIVLYKTDITTANGANTQLLLSPISVHPQYQRRGIARRMVEAALPLARGMGFGAVFLCGDPDIYQRLGFSPTHHYQIYHINDGGRSAAWSMVREIVPHALDGVTGTIETV